MAKVTIYAVQEDWHCNEDLTVFCDEYRAIRHAIEAWDHLTDREKVDRRIYVLEISGNVEHPNERGELIDLAFANIETYDAIVWDSWEYEHEHIAWLIEDELEKYMEEQHVVVKHSSGVECMVRHYIMQELKQMDGAAGELTLREDVEGWVLDAFKEEVDNVAAGEAWGQRDKAYRLVYVGEEEEE